MVLAYGLPLQAILLHVVLLAISKTGSLVRSAEGVVVYRDSYILLRLEHPVPQLEWPPGHPP